MDPREPQDQDGLVLDAKRQADVAAIRDLVAAYAHAVDDRDWERWQRLFTEDALIDYTSSGGIAGGPVEVGEWMPGALSLFEWSLHSAFTHEVRFTGADSATGRVHLLNRNGVLWEGTREICDIGGLYLDEYRRVGEAWRFSRRVEHTLYVTGGAFAAVVRSLSAKASPDGSAPYG